MIALFVTGVSWWALDSASSVVRLYLIAAHGLAAMVFLVTLGVILVLHVREGWRLQLNRVSGVFVLTVISLLILTAFALYYVGSDILRSVVSLLHIVVGFVLPPMLVIHIVFGRRSRVRSVSLQARNIG